MKLQSTFAMLDVLRGRKQLSKVMQGGYPKNGQRVPVTIHGFITHQHGSDDGISIEFGVEVTKVEAGT